MRAVLPDTRVIDYVHDSSGRRVAKKINNVTVEKYLWLGLTRLLAVYDGSNNLVARFEYADDRVPYAMTTGATTYYLGYDQVGSLRTVANSSGVIVKRVDYDSFGNIITDTAPALKVPFGFAGGLHDRDTGLVRFGYRDYDPETGRWTAKDPIGFAGGDVDLYGYVESDPINFVDPYGLYWLKDASDFSAGFGDFITFGATGWLREQWGYNNVVDHCSGWYTGGQVTGGIAGLTYGGVASLNAGARTVLYSGQGAYEAALANKGAGKILADTLGGKGLNFIDKNIVRVPQKVWDAASGIFASNAKGNVQVFLRNPKADSVYRRIEEPVLNFFNNTTKVFR